MSTHHSVTIIGAGPAGLTAAIYAGRAQLNPFVVADDGGQLMITSEVENYPGFAENIDGPELVDNMIKQAERFGAQIVCGRATNFDFKNKPFSYKVDDEIHTTDCIVLANGASAIWLNLPNDHLYKNNGISACATCDGPLPIFRKKHIHVIGGGDSAIEEALFLTHFASEVTIIHRRDTLRASKIMQKRAFENPKINFVWDSTITEYISSDIANKTSNGRLEALKLKNLKTGEEQIVQTGGLFMAIGHQPNTKELEGTGLDLDEKGYIVTHDQVLTNIPGVFAAGDVHDSIYRQAVTAAGFGCMAAITAERWLAN